MKRGSVGHALPVLAKGLSVCAACVFASWVAGATPPHDAGVGSAAGTEVGTNPPSGPGTRHEEAGSGAEPTPRPQGMVGLRLYMRNRPCFVQEVLAGGPAASAGALPGDRIVAVDGERIDELDIRKVVGLIKGTPGTPVTLTLQQPGQPPRDVTIVRAILEPRKRAVRVATSALPRLKAFAHRGELDAMMKAFEEVTSKEGPEPRAAACPVVIDALSLSGEDHYRDRAKELLPTGIDATPGDIRLAKAVARLYLEDAPHDPAEVAHAATLCRRALHLLEPARHDDRSAAHAWSVWSATLARADIASGKEQRGLRRMVEAIEQQPGDRMAALSPAGETLWTSALGPADLWEVLASRYLETGNRQRARALAIEAMRWHRDLETARRIVEAADGGEANIDTFSVSAWPVTPLPAPPLEMVDLAGQVHSLGDLHGNVVIVSLWATWCGPCRQEFEMFKRHYAAWRRQGVEILALSLDQDRSLVPPFVASRAIPFPVGFASNPDPLYRSRNVPVTFLVDREGLLAWSHVGFGTKTEEELVSRVEALLAPGADMAQPLVAEAFGIERLALEAHTPLPRLVSVAVAGGEDGPEIWALGGNGVLTVLRYPPARAIEEGSTARLEVVRTLSGMNRFDRVAAMQMDGEGLFERLLFRHGAGLLVGENATGTETLLFAATSSGILDVLPVPPTGTEPGYVAIDHGKDGVLLVDSAGVTRWRWEGSAGLGLALEETESGVGAEKRRIVVPADGRRLVFLDLAGRFVDEMDAGGPVARVLPLRIGAGSTGWLVLEPRVRGVAVDLDGDGRDEVAGLLASDTLFLLGGNGELRARLTFHGSRLSLAAGDLDGDGKAELVVGGDGTGVLVVGGAVAGAPGGRG